MRILLTFLLLIGIGEAQTAGSDLLQRAEAGDVAAQLSAARAYQNGDGVARDLRQSGVWYARAAKQGNGDAMYALGTMLYNGDALGVGLAENLELAWAWFALAADAGVPLAAEARDRTASELTPIRLETAYWTAAALLLDGERLPRNQQAAMRYIEWLRQRGSPLASLQLADMYLSGNGVPQDYGKASAMCSEIAKKLPARSYCLGVIYQRTNRPLEAFTAIRKAAEGGYAGAILPLAECYAEGKGTSPDLVKALSWTITAERLRLAGAAQKRVQLEQRIAEKQRRKATQQANKRGLDFGPANMGPRRK